MARKKLFYVVKFIEAPSEGIDEYVCVPCSWGIMRRMSDPKVSVAYPKNEDPFITRDRVERREHANVEWRFYAALVEHKSENYMDAKLWTAMKNNQGPGDEHSEIGDAEPESALNRKLCNAGQHFWPDPNTDKPRLTVYKNPRKLLPRIKIKRPPSEPDNDKNLNSIRLKFNGKPKLGIVPDHTIVASEDSEEERTIIITDNQTKTSPTFNGEMKSDQCTQPRVVKENQSVNMSIQSISTELPAEQQPLLKRSAEPQYSLQHATDRQPQTKLAIEQQPLSKLSDEQQTSLTGQSYQEPFDLSVKDKDRSNEDMEIYQEGLSEPVMNKIPSTETPPITLEQDPVKEKSPLLLHNEHTLSVQRPQVIAAEPLIGPNDIRKPPLHWTLTAPTTVSLASTANNPCQQYRHPQLPALPVSKTSNSTLQPQVIVGSNSMDAAHNYQRPSTSYNQPNSDKLFQILKPASKKQSPIVNQLTNSINKKNALKGITKQISAIQYSPNSMIQISLPGDSAVTQAAPFTQHYLQQAQGLLANNQKTPVPQGIINTSISAAQNLSQLAHQYRPNVEASYNQQHLPIQEDYLQQFVRMQDLLGRTTMAQTIDQRVYQPNATMNGRFVSQSQPNAMDQMIPFYPRNNNKYIPVKSCEGRHPQYEVMRGLDGLHTTHKRNTQNGVNIQLSAHNVSNHSLQNFKHPQHILDPRNYQLPYTTSIQNGLPLEYSNMNLAEVPKNLIDLAPSTQDYEVQTMSSSDRPHEIPASSLFKSNQVYQHPCTKKIMVEQATETDLMMDVDHYVDENAGSSFSESFSKVVDAACQTDESLREEQGSPYQETNSNSEIATDEETESEIEPVSEVSQPQSETTACPVEQDMLNIIGTLVTQMGACLSVMSDMFNDLRNSVLECTHTYKELTEKVDILNSMDTLTHTTQILKSSPNNVTSQAAQVIQGRKAGGNDILQMPESPPNSVTSQAAQVIQGRKAEGNYILQMPESPPTSVTSQAAQVIQGRKAGGNYILQMPESPPNSVTSQAAQVNQRRKAGDNDNLHHTPKSSPNNVTSQAAQVIQGRKAGDTDNNNGVGDAPTLINEQRGTFSLPAEYDPNDTKWTLKYREHKRLLVELIPRTGIYVSKKELKRCIEKSNDCRTLARLLLTEVFSKKALSVCSLTGARAKAFKSVNIDVRPGLDADAMQVLLAFVETHGKKRGWNTSKTEAVKSTIRTKIREVRAKHGQLTRLARKD